MKNTPVLINRELLASVANRLVPHLMREAFEDGIRSHGFKDTLGLVLCFGNVSGVADEEDTTYVMRSIHTSSTASEEDATAINTWLEKCSGYAQMKLALTMEYGIETVLS